MILLGCCLDWNALWYCWLFIRLHGNCSVGHCVDGWMDGQVVGYLWTLNSNSYKMYNIYLY